MKNPYIYFSHNGDILPVEQAVVPLASVEYAYGFGVYETIRVSSGTAYFLPEHCQRLMESARAIGLEHPFDQAAIASNILELVAKNQVTAANLKVVLLGGRTPDAANLYIQCLNPLFPDRKLYKTGAVCLTEQYERPYPHAKSLNMLPSYLAYRRARQAGAYDALLVNRAGSITEGTRTNFFALQGRTITSPPATEILLGVTRHHVLRLARQHGFTVVEQPIPLADVGGFDGAFLTSTSAKIMPVRAIDEQGWDSVPPALLELMDTFNEYLDGLSPVVGQP